jgi:hypothetical protein
MKPIIINHPLRIISLVYKSNANLSDFESSALQQYQILHNEAMDIKNGFIQLKQEIKRMEEWLHRLVHAMTILETNTKRYRNLAGYTEELSGIKPQEYTLKPRELKHEAANMQSMIDKYWLKRDKLAEELKQLLEKDKAFESKFSVFKEEFFSPIIRDWEKMEIDTVSLDMDMNAFCVELTAIDKIHDDVIEEWNGWARGQDEFVMAIKTLFDRINNVFTKTNTTAIIHCTNDGQIIYNPSERLFLVKPGDPVIEKYRETFENTAEKPDNNLVLTVGPDVVRDLDLGMMHELLLALQHYPGVIEQLVFGIDFNFLMMEDLDIKLNEMEWKTQPAYYRWFNKMGESPAAIFFIKDSDARFYSLAGDMMADGKIKSRKEPGNNKYISLIPDEGQLKIIFDRFYHGCWFFLMYCHGSGFDPKIYIEALIAEYDMPFSYKDVKEKYKEDVEKGIEFRVKKKK